MKAKKSNSAASKPKQEGPYIAVAVFCENAIQEKDNVFSVMRIIDRIIAYIPEDAPADVPSDTKRLPINVNAFISFKTGFKPGKYPLVMTIISPSGKRNEPLNHEMKLEGVPNGSGNLFIRIQLGVSSTGVHLMEVKFNGQVITMMPLQIEVERKTIETGMSLLSDRFTDSNQEIAKPKKKKKR